MASCTVCCLRGARAPPSAFPIPPVDAPIPPPSPQTGPAFRAYRPSDKEAILSLLGQGRHPDYLAHKRALFDWQFHANPASAFRPAFIVGELDGEPVAINGLMPVRARVGGQPTTVCWALDVFVSERHRGKGLGRALIGQVSASASVMLVYGISDMSDPIFERQAWVLDASMQTHFLHLGEPGWRGRLKNARSWLGRMWRARGGMGDVMATTRHVPTDDALQALWLRVADQFPNAVERNARYLAWRYKGAPLLTYRWTQAHHEGQLAGVMVWRRAAGESVLVDYLGPLDQPQVLRALIRATVRDLASGDGTRRIRCECNHPQVKKALLAEGFRAYRNPGRFRVRVNASESPGHPTPTGPWFIFTGDSDNDLLDLTQPLR